MVADTHTMCVSVEMFTGLMICLSKKIIAGYPQRTFFGNHHSIPADIYVLRCSPAINCGYYSEYWIRRYAHALTACDSPQP